MPMSIWTLQPQMEIVFLKHQKTRRHHCRFYHYNHHHHYHYHYYLVIPKETKQHSHQNNHYQNQQLKLQPPPQLSLKTAAGEFRTQLVPMNLTTSLPMMTTKLNLSLMVVNRYMMMLLKKKNAFFLVIYSFVLVCCCCLTVNAVVDIMFGFFLSFVRC
jgi:hypothetical protein